MEAAVAPVRAGNEVQAGAAPGEKGLKTGAIGFLSNVVIGVASVAPGYSAAATLGLIAAAVGFQSPAIMIVAFVPMLFIAFAYRYLNKADPDAGTTFAWVTRAMGPRLGWLNGWAIIVADVVVMASLAHIAGLYTFKLFDSSANPSTLAITLVGVVWIVVMTAIVYIGIELSARTQQFLLAAELSILTVFGVVALIKVYADNPKGSSHVAGSWFSPFAASSSSAVIAGVLLATFIYWGWDSGVAVNEETKDPRESPGLAAVISTLVLVGIYVLLAVSTTAFAGPAFLSNHSDDVLSSLGRQVFGSPLDKLLIIAVLTSAAASTQTTILPTARTALSMARWKAIPESFGRVHERHLTPHVATFAMGAASVAWLVFLALLGSNVLSDTIDALGLMIAFYYGFTGFACVWYYRRTLTASAKNFVYAGVLPLAGGLMLGYIFVKSVINLSDPKQTTSGDNWLGLGAPLVIGIASLILGLVLMVWAAHYRSPFWKRHTETATEPAIEPSHPAVPPATPPVAGAPGTP